MEPKVVPLRSHAGQTAIFKEHRAPMQVKLLFSRKKSKAKT
jgi:hypothetical protein